MVYSPTRRELLTDTIRAVGAAYATRFLGGCASAPPRGKHQAPGVYAVDPDGPKPAPEPEPRRTSVHRQHAKPPQPEPTCLDDFVDGEPTYKGITCLVYKHGEWGKDEDHDAFDAQSKVYTWKGPLVYSTRPGGRAKRIGISYNPQEELLELAVLKRKGKKIEHRRYFLNEKLEIVSYSYKEFKFSKKANGWVERGGKQYDGSVVIKTKYKRKKGLVDGKPKSAKKKSLKAWKRQVNKYLPRSIAHLIKLEQRQRH